MEEQELTGGQVTGGQQEDSGANQNEPMPSSEQKPVENLEGSALPEEVSERTRTEFEKLKTKNKELAEKLSRYESSELGDSVFDILGKQQKAEAPFLSRGQVDNITTQFIDRDGNVDIEGLNKAISEANLRAKRAEEAALKTREDSEVREAHKEFPWLNPRDPEFDREKFELVRDRIFRNMVEGREIPLVDVVRGLKLQPNQDVSKEKERAVEDFKKTQVVKNQATNVSTTKTQKDDYSLDDLRERTRHGDTSALHERLSRVTTLK